MYNQRIVIMKIIHSFSLQQSYREMAKQLDEKHTQDHKVINSI